MKQSMPVLREPAVKRRGNRRLKMVLLLLFIVVLSVLFFNSSISEVSTVTVAGQRFVNEDSIRKLSGISIGDAFFGFTERSVERKLRTSKSIEQATVTKVFPGEVRIRVQEFAAVGYELSPEGEIMAILSNGTSVPATNADFVVDKPLLSGWKKDDPIKTALSKQLALIPAQQLSDLSEIRPDPSNAYPDRIRIYTRTRFEVITAVSVLATKLDTLNAVTETQQPGRVTMLLADTYEPYLPDSAENMETLEKESTQ
ncbi:FtsQ-type POTRA domain-containing protein [Paenibacillus sp. PR3]|uniref:Cell division protein DivIB n=1 Tax=Paenibacillus terricola TaxID=2763503 RepID=A0ABR8MPV1_9BACL|nr:FtsQ-type POTRA domain-containing protein [Paenibacillus terricola]MBD3918017.1 FtsQ-type POTRA domain-containing protein [Paenibacillus terricola]